MISFRKILLGMGIIVRVFGWHPIPTLLAEHHSFRWSGKDCITHHSFGLFQCKAGRFDTTSLVYPIGSILVEFSDQLPLGLVEESKDLLLDLGLATERAKASFSAVVFQFRPLQTISFPQNHSVEIRWAVWLTHGRYLIWRLVLGTHDGLVTNQPNRKNNSLRFYLEVLVDRSRKQPTNQHRNWIGTQGLY